MGTALVLKRLALADVLDMVRDLSAAGTALPDGIAGRLYHETEGLPLFLAAYLEVLAQSSEKGRRGRVAGAARRVRSPTGPAGAAAAAALQTLQAAAVLGRSSTSKWYRRPAAAATRRSYLHRDIGRPGDNHRGS